MRFSYDAGTNSFTGRPLVCACNFAVCGREEPTRLGGGRKRYEPFSREMEGEACAIRTLGMLKGMGEGWQDSEENGPGPRLHYVLDCHGMVK